MYIASCELPISKPTDTCIQNKQIDSIIHVYNYLQTQIFNKFVYVHVYCKFKA